MVICGEILNWVLRSLIELCPWLQVTVESFWPKQGVSGVRSMLGTSAL